MSAMITLRMLSLAPATIAWHFVEHAAIVLWRCEREDDQFKKTRCDHFMSIRDDGSGGIIDPSPWLYC